MEPNPQKPITKPPIRYGGQYRASASRFVASATRHTSNGPRQTKTNPSLQAYRDRRSAYRLLLKFKNIPDTEMSETQLASKKWAQDIAEKAATRRQTLTEQAAAKPAAKRQHSEEKSDHASKKTHTGSPPKRPSIAAEKVPHVRAVIDRSHQDGNITPANWMLVEMALLKKFKELLSENPGPLPQCTDAGWFQGRVKLVSCADQRSAEFYEKAISKLGEVWPGSQLEAVMQGNIPHKPRSRTWIPAEPSQPEDILDFLRICNPDLPTHDWRVAKVGEEVGGKRQAVIILNNESLAPILEKKGVVHYGLTSINLYIYSSDAKFVSPKDEIVANEVEVLKVCSEEATAVTNESTD